jgi:hypothetical protein
MMLSLLVSHLLKALASSLLSITVKVEFVELVTLLVVMLLRVPL